MMETSPPGVISVISSGKHRRGPVGKTPPSGRGDNSRQKIGGDGPDDVPYAFASTCTISADVRSSLLQTKSDQWFRHVEVRAGKLVTYFVVPSASRIDDLLQLQLKEIWSARSAEYIVREAYFFRYSTWLEFPGIGTTPIIEAYTVARPPRNTQPFEGRTVACADGLAGLPLSRLEYVAREAGAVAFVVGDTQVADVLLSDDRTTTTASGLVVLDLLGLKRALLTGELPPNQAPMVIEEDVTPHPAATELPGGETEAEAQQNDALHALDETSGGLDGPSSDVGEDEAQETEALSTARTALKQGFVHVVEHMLKDLQVGSCSEETLLTLSDASVSLGNMRCVCHELSEKVSLDGLRAVSIPTKPPEAPSQTAAWCLAQHRANNLKSFFQGNFPDLDIDGKSTSDLQALGAEKVSTRLQQRFGWASDPPKVFVLTRCGAALTTCKNCGCLLGEKVSVIWRQIGQNKFEPTITPIERAVSEDQALDFVTGAAPHHSQGKELLKAMGCFNVDAVPKHDDLVRAHPSAAHALIRALCARGSGGVDQSNSYDTNNKLRALVGSRRLQMAAVGLSSLSEHARRGPFVFDDSDNTATVVQVLHDSWVVLSGASGGGFHSKSAHPWYSKDRKNKLCVRRVTLDALLGDTELFSEVSVVLPGSSEALRGAQLRRPDIEREHLVCWMVKVRDAFQIQHKQIISSNSDKALWRLQLSAHFLEQFAWPPDSSSLASLTMNIPQSRSKAFLQAAALAGRGF